MLRALRMFILLFVFMFVLIFSTGLLFIAVLFLLLSTAWKDSKIETLEKELKDKSKSKWRRIRERQQNKEV